MVGGRRGRIEGGKAVNLCDAWNVCLGPNDEMYAYRLKFKRKNKSRTQLNLFLKPGNCLDFHESRILLAKFRLGSLLLLGSIHLTYYIIQLHPTQFAKKKERKKNTRIILASGAQPRVVTYLING